MKSRKLIAASALAAALIAGPVLAGSIQVSDGHGGWTDYVPQKPPTGPTGISVDDGRGGWKPYTPPRPGPEFAYRNADGAWVEWKPPAGRRLAPKPIRRAVSHGWTYYLMQDRNTGDFFIQIEDANGADVHINGEVPMPGGGPLYPVR